jgi:hypothetical protein
VFVNPAGSVRNASDSVSSEFDGLVVSMHATAIRKIAATPAHRVILFIVEVLLVRVGVCGVSRLSTRGTGDTLT